MKKACGEVSFTAGSDSRSPLIPRRGAPCLQQKTLLPVPPKSRKSKSSHKRTPQTSSSFLMWPLSSAVRSVPPYVSTAQFPCQSKIYDIPLKSGAYPATKIVAFSSFGALTPKSIELLGIFVEFAPRRKSRPPGQDDTLPRERPRGKRGRARGAYQAARGAAFVFISFFVPSQRAPPQRPPSEASESRRWVW